MIGDEADLHRGLIEVGGGEPLDAVLMYYRPDLPTCLRLASQLAQTLAGLHAAHTIHRQLCPSNVLVSVDKGQLHLLELRSAEARQTSAENHPAAGEWAYFSPEQTGRMNLPVDYRSDFYSLGVLLYRMLAGQLPFQGKDPLEWAHCHIARLPPPLPDLAPAVPQPVAEIVMRLLAKLPEDRYQSARGLVGEVRQPVIEKHGYFNLMLSNSCKRSFILETAIAAPIFL